MSRIGDWWARRRRRIPATPQAWFSAVERVSRGSGIDDFFAFQGVGYSGTPVELPAGQSYERMEGDFTGLIRDGLKGNSIVFACERLRVAVFSELKFAFQDESDDGRAGELHTRTATRLADLRKPWRGGTTGDLAARALLHRDFGGNAYILRSRNGTGLRCMRPDWVSIIMGTDEGPGDPNDVDAEIIGYAYWPGGYQTGKVPDLFLADEVCHFAPYPDPAAHYRGMSWLNPIITEFQADTSATNHKLQFFRNNATLQTVVTVDKEIEEKAFARLMAKINAETRGIINAYKTLFVTGGVDVKVVGADLRQLDFKATQGAGETRIAAAAGTPPILVGLSEGLAAGQYNIYGQAKRSFVDGTIRPEWRNFCGSLETLVTPPVGSRLWYDDRDIPYLREDLRDQADIFHLQASAVQILINSGWKPDAAAKAASTGDILAILGEHTGLYSVQLQPPSAGTMNAQPAIPAQLAAPALPAGPGAELTQIPRKRTPAAIGAS